MSTDAEELAKTFLGIKARHLLFVVASCCAFIASLGAGLAAWQKMGLPLPASRGFVVAELNELSGTLEELSSFAKQSRQLILSDKWWRLQEAIDEVSEKLLEHPANSMLRDRQRRLKRDQQEVQRQIDMLERQ